MSIQGNDVILNKKQELKEALSAFYRCKMSYYGAIGMDIVLDSMSYDELQKTANTLF